MEVVTSTVNVESGRAQLQTNLQAAALVRQKEVAEEQGEQAVRLIEAATIRNQSPGQLLDVRV